MKLRGAVSYAIILFFLVWCAIVFRADIAQIKFAPIWGARNAVLLATLLSLFNYALRTVRWSLYLTRLGHPLPASFCALTYIAGFAFTLSPGKVGELVRGRYYQRVGISLSSTTAAFFIERLMDLLAMLTLASLSLASSSAFERLIWVTIGVIVTVLAVLALAPWERFLKWLQSVAWFTPSLKKPIGGILRTLLFARVLLQPKLLAIGFVIGLIAWGAEGIGLMVIGAISPGVSLDWATATGIYSVAIIVGALSFLPGGLGSTEAVMIGLLATHGYSVPDAILLTLVCRLLTLWFAVVIGWIAVIALRNNPMFEANNR